MDAALSGFRTTIELIDFDLRSAKRKHDKALDECQFDVAAAIATNQYDKLLDRRLELMALEPVAQ